MTRGLHGVRDLRLGSLRGTRMWLENGAPHLFALTQCVSSFVVKNSLSSKRRMIGVGLKSFVASVGLKPPRILIVLEIGIQDFDQSAAAGDVLDGHQELNASIQFRGIQSALLIKTCSSPPW